MSAVVLLQLGIKASIVLGLAGLVAFSMRRASAAARHLVWTAGIAATLGLPLVQVVGPTWNVSVPESAWSIATAHSVDVALRPTPTPVVASSHSPFEGDAAEPAIGIPTASAQTSSTIVASMSSLGLGRLAFSLGPLNTLLALWVAGAFFMMARLACGLLRARHIALQASEVTDDGVVSGG